MPARWFFTVLANIEDLEYEQRNYWLHELLDVMPAAQCIPEYRQAMQEIYKKRILGENKSFSKENRAMDPGDPRAIQWMESHFKQASKLIGQ